MTNPQIDLDTLKQMISMLTPAPIAPIKELAPISNSQDMLMNADIQRIKEDIHEIKGTLKEITTTHVTVNEFNEHVKKNDITHGDHETRLRSVETSTTRILVWGSVIIILSTLAQFALKLLGH